MDKLPYPLNSDELERWRLGVQAAAIRPLSMRLLQGVDVTDGCDVLDLGCGPGDLSFLAAELVGPSGSVTGVDRDPVQIAAARERARALGLSNTTFVESDLADFVPNAKFDAVVGRYVLIYVPNPDDVVNLASEWLTPGGRIGFLEMNFYPGIASNIWPPVSAHAARAIRYIGEIMMEAGVHTDMAARLPSMLARFGDVGVDTSAPPQWGPKSLALPLAALQSVLPIARRLGNPSAELFDPQAIFEAESLGRDHTTVTTPPVSIAAWVITAPSS